MKKRTDIPVESTWDLTHLYPSHQEWEQALQTIETLTAQIAAKRGSITQSAENLLTSLQLMDSLGLKLEWAGSYAHMHFDEDMGNTQAKTDYERMDNLYAKLGDQLSFYEPELLQLTPETFNTFKQTQPALSTYAFMFEKLFKQREHVLAAEQEEILSRLDSLGGSFRKIFDDITVNDLEFPEIEDEQGQKVIANEVNYRKMLNSYDRRVREQFFTALLSTYGSHINSLTSTILGNIKSRLFTAKTRKYPSSRQMAMEGNHVPPEVYDTLIQTVRDHVQRLHRYLAIRKKSLGYSELHFYDLFVPLLPDLKEDYTFAQAQDIILAALTPLGEDYQGVLKEAFTSRWIDVYPNKGKASGAYANGIYGLHPYSLLNFNGTLEDLFTLAHELGHVMHSYYSNKHQPYVDSSYVIFTAEVASTVNEYLLYRYLLEKSDTAQKQAHLLSLHLDSIRSTLYRQTFFADFEMQLHQMVQDDQPVTPEALCQTYKTLYQHYHGADFVIDDELTYEWARIPHFYSSFYVYQYATGISAAIALAKAITEKKPGSQEAYLSFLTRGGSDYPIPLLQGAGVNMSTPQPILAALEDFSETLERLEQLLAT